MSQNLFLQSFLNDCFASHYKVVALCGDGSARKIFRVFHQNKTFILVYSQNKKETCRFLCLSSALKKSNIAVPTIYAVDKEQIFYLQEDLGAKNFAEILMEQTTSQKQILADYLTIIEDLQNLYTKKEVLQECNIKEKLQELLPEHIVYFKKYFLGYFDKKKQFTTFIQEETSLLVDILSSYCQTTKSGLVTRDFQARNIFFYKNKTYFIDYQDICEGHIFYDLASLLFASFSKLIPSTRKQLITRLTKNYFSKENDFFIFFSFVLIRRLRSLGTYTKLGIMQKKSNFQNHFQKTFQELLAINEEYNVYQRFPKIIKMLTYFSKINL